MKTGQRLSRISVFAFAVASSIALGGCSFMQSDPLAEAQEHFAGQDYVSAQIDVLAALQEDASDPTALELLARIQLAMGRGADANLTLDRLKDAGVLPADAALIEAEALLQSGNHRAALTLLRGREGAESWRLRALAAAMAGDNDGALRAFAMGKGANGDKRRLFVAEANHHLARNDVDAARPAVRQAQLLAPDNVETLYVSARLAEQEGEPELAARAYMAIIKRFPADKPALLGAIQTLDMIGRIDLVRDLIARGRTAYPEDVEFLYLEASLQAFDGNWFNVRKMLQQHEAMVIEHDKARGLYGQALLELGQLEQARAQLAPLHRRYPDNVAYARVLTRTLIASGEHAAAYAIIGPFAGRRDAAIIDRQLAEEAARGRASAS
ncbi:MAG: tetratricopeptide repeat protein [Alteraurantiacibacter sp. bin_em_oilr2.035]|nr:tetratricopeptide repeat protein [Alteraurantiacibacter sp. bin_em_oilr2.035]